MATTAAWPPRPGHGVDLGWLSIASIFVFLDMVVWVHFPAGSDWAPLWSAGRLSWTDPARIYDFELLAQLQLPITGNADFHPYIYPPSALLLIAPIALMPFWGSALVVAAGSLTWLGATVRKVGSGPLLVILAPPVSLAAIVGQTSIFVIGLVVLACTLLDRRERTAGALLAMAALIKPTLIVLAPLALVAGRHWNALASAMLVGLIGLGASVALFGLQPWFEWAQAVSRFQQMFVENEPLVRNAVSPYAFATRYGFENSAIIVIGAIVASVLTWIGFARRIEPEIKSALLMGGALLLTPYAMHYELAVFAPALLSLPRKDMRNLAVCGVWGFSLLFNAGVLGLLVAYTALVAPLISARRSQSKTGDATSC